MDPRPDIDSWTFGPAEGVPDPIAPYAHVTRFGGLLFVTGQMPIDAATGRTVGDDVTTQTHRVLDNLARVLAAVGSSLDDTLHCRAYLRDMDDYEAFNRAYATWFPHRLPSRTCVGVSGLAGDARVEIDLVVAAPGR